MSIEDLDIDLSALRTQQCRTGQDGDLEATQCSASYGTTGASVAEQVCDSDQVTIFDTWQVNTEEKDIKWEGRGTKVVVTENIYGGLEFMTEDIQTDEIEITNRYFDESGSQFAIPQQSPITNAESGTWLNPIGGRVLDRTNPRGVCGEGEVERGQYSVPQQTSAGTGQGNCPWD